MPCLRFNSRTLGRVRLHLVRLVSSCYHVSIHAPWEGCDARMPRSRSAPTFQFTHPGKGATTAEIHDPDYPHVSIHAPWEGCDYSFSIVYLKSLLFQFTHPGKGATEGLTSDTRGTAVSIHAPWEGCDCPSATPARWARVSIHAPWEGCDGSRLSSAKTDSQFQFTHPGKGATVWCKGAYYRADKQA